MENIGQKRDQNKASFGNLVGLGLVGTIGNKIQENKTFNGDKFLLLFFCIKTVLSYLSTSCSLYIQCYAKLFDCYSTPCKKMRKNQLLY